MAKEKDVNVLLKTAVVQGNLGMVKDLVNKNGADIHARDKQGQNTLQYAAEQKQWDIAKWLISAKGAYMNKQMPLMAYAVTHHLWELVRWIGDTKLASVNISVPYQCSAKYGTSPETIKTPLLSYAATCGKWDIVQWLADQKGASVNINVPDWRGKHGSDAQTIQTPLLAYAAEQGKWDIVKWLVDEKGARINIPVTEYHGTYKRTDTKHTLLTWAAKSDQWGIVQWLVDEKRVDVNATAEKTSTPFIAYVVAAGKLEMLQLLITKGIDLKVNIKDGSQELSLVAHAIVKGQWEIVKWFIDKKMVDVNITVRDDYNGIEIPLIAYAAKKEGWDMVEWLARKDSTNVNVNVHTREDYNDIKEMSLIAYAAKKDQWEVVRCLVNEQNVNSNVIMKGSYRDNFKEIPLIAYVAGKDQWELVRALISVGVNLNVNVYTKENYYHDKGMPLITYIAQKGQWEVIKGWVELKANGNIEDDLKVLLLITAVANGNIEMMKWLVDDKNFDVNVNIKDDYRDIEMPLLVYTAQQGQWDMAQWLIKEKGGEAKLVLNAAAGHSKWDIVQWLVDERGVEVNSQSQQKQETWLLGLAAKDGRIDILKWLIDEKGMDADTNIEDYSGEMPLLVYAAQKGQWVIVQWLVNEQGLNTASNIGTLLLQAAAINGEWSIVRWLIDERGVPANVIINIRDNSTEDLLVVYAAKNNQWEMVKWLIDKRGIGAELVLDTTVINDKWDMIEWLIDEKNVKAELALGAAAINGVWDIVRRLIDERDVDTNLMIKNDSNGTKEPLVAYAARNQQWDIVRWLVDKRDIQINDITDIKSVLAYAVKANEWDIVQWVLEEQDVGTNIMLVDIDNCNSYGDKTAHTLLGHAAKNDRWDMVKWLVEYGAGVDINLEIEYRPVPLIIYAAQKGKWDMVRLFVEKGADINLKGDIEEWVPYDYSARGHQRDFSYDSRERFYGDYDDDYSDHYHSQRGEYKRMHNVSLIYYAATKDKWEMVTSLMEEHGADITVKVYDDGSERSVLSVASKCAKLEVVKALLAKGADMNHTDIVRYIFSLPPIQLTSEVKKIIYLNILSYYGADGLEKFSLSCMEAAPDIDVFDILKEGELLYYSEAAEKLGGGVNPASITLKCLQYKSVNASALQNEIVPSLQQLCARAIAKNPEEYFVLLGIATIYNMQNVRLSDNTEIVEDDVGNIGLGNPQLGYHADDYN